MSTELKRLSALNPTVAALVEERDSLKSDLEAARADTVVQSLSHFQAWRLHRYAQPFDNGKVLDPIYECQILGPDEKWGRTEYGATPEIAIERAIEALSPAANDGDKRE